MDVCSGEEVFAKIETAISGGKQLRIHTLNADHVVLAHSNRAFAQSIATASIVVPDGMPIVWALRSRGIKQMRITGADLMATILKQMPVRCGIVGGAPGVAREVAQRGLRESWAATVVSTYSPSREEITSNEYKTKLISELRGQKLDVLFASLGAPLQECWLAESEERLGIPVLLGVGAGVDFLAGRVPRAPQFMRDMGMEWLYRMAREPRRLAGRYVGRDWRLLCYILRYRLHPAPMFEVATRRLLN